jgi:hypothetical protein
MAIHSGGCGRASARHTAWDSELCRRVESGAVRKGQKTKGFNSCVPAMCIRATAESLYPLDPWVMESVGPHACHTKRAENIYRCHCLTSAANVGATYSKLFGSLRHRKQILHRLHRSVPASDRSRDVQLPLARTYTGSEVNSFSIRWLQLRDIGL